MVNSVMLVGRMKSNLKESGNEFIIQVSRVEKNDEGIYEYDLIPVICWEGISKQMKEYCTEGSTIGIRGRLETKGKKVIVIAEKVTFLSNVKKDNE